MHEKYTNCKIKQQNVFYFKKQKHILKSKYFFGIFHPTRRKSQNSRPDPYIEHPRSVVVYNFGRSRLSICLSVYLSVRP